MKTEQLKRKTINVSKLTKNKIDDALIRAGVKMGYNEFLYNLCEQFLSEKKELV